MYVYFIYPAYFDEKSQNKHGHNEILTCKSYDFEY
jgi:hypothetical protein